MNDTASKFNITDKLESLVQNIETLPVLPKIGTELFKMLNDENRTAQKVSDVISSDPAITAQILKVANSAFYKRQHQISTLKHAITMLGLSEVEKMAMALCSSAMSKHKLSPDLNVNISDFNAHLVMTAQLASRLLGIFKFTMSIPAEMYAIALFHDVGALVLGLNFPKDLKKVMDNIYKDKITFVESVKRYWGVTPVQVGGWLVAKWQLPKVFVETILFQNGAISKKILIPEYIVALKVANRLAAEFNLRNPFDSQEELEGLSDDILEFLKKAGVKWEDDLIAELIEGHYEDFIEMQNKAHMLTQISVSFVDKGTAYIVREPKHIM